MEDASRTLLRVFEQESFPVKDIDSSFGHSLLCRHMQSPGYDLLSPEFTPEKLDLYFSNLLQRPLQGGEPIRGLSTSFGRGWWINQKLKHILKDLDEMFGKTPEEALRIVQEMIAIQQVHSYAMSVAATGAQFEPAALERTMGYSLSLAKQAIERGVLVVVLARWSHWDKVLDLSGRPDLKVIRFKKKATQRRIPNISEKVIDPETSNANYNDLLNALGGVPTANPPSPSTKRRSKPVATPGTPAKSEAREGQKGRQTNAEVWSTNFFRANPRRCFVVMTDFVDVQQLVSSCCVVGFVSRRLRLDCCESVLL